MGDLASVPSERRHEKYERLIAATQDVPPITCAVVHPCDQSSLAGAVEAAEARIIAPILVGPQHKLRDTAEEFHLDITQFEIVDAPHSHAAAAQAVELVRGGS